VRCEWRDERDLKSQRRRRTETEISPQHGVSRVDEMRSLCSQPVGIGAVNVPKK
jgi:hypothetical protein